MTQMSFSDAEYSGKRKRTQRERFLQEMEQVVPWQALLALIEPAYPKAGNGRRPYPLNTMLHVHLMQNWFGYSDPAMEEALYEVAPLRRFAGLSLSRGGVPDETTILNFRRLLETHALAPAVLTTVNAHLTDHGLLLKQGTIFDATIIHAPSSTKNQDKARDPEMHQTRKGNQWYFGMKAHIGVDVEGGLVHTVTTTPANVADVVEVGKLLHGKEKTVFADAGYIGASKRAGKRGRKWFIAAKHGSVKALPDGERKTPPSILNTSKPRCAPRSSTRSVSSSGSSATRRCASRDSQRIPARSSSCLRSLTCGWRDEDCCRMQETCARDGRNSPLRRTSGAGNGRHPVVRNVSIG